jgi:hypothetical protein
VTGDDLRRFARRDWASTARRKLHFWAEQFQQHGASPARLASTALLLHVRAVQPDYPSPEDRADDLAHHLALRHRLDRAARAFTRR